MGTNPTKAADNIYCQCRKRAARYNDKLHSHEGASKLLGISVSTLAGYELGTVKSMPPESVVLMADLYNAPKLKNYFCTNECPIGRASIAQLEVAELDRLTVKLLASLCKVDDIKDDLLDITADGVIDTHETAALEGVLKSLDLISRHAQELKLYAERLQAERRVKIMSFASRLKQAMDEREISQSELSILTGIGKFSISQYLSGKNVSKDKVKEKIAVALDCTPEYLDEVTPNTDYTIGGLHNIPVAVAAKWLDKSERFIRVSLQTGAAPFGFTSKNKTKWSYHISPKKLDEYISHEEKSTLRMAIPKGADEKIS